MGMRLGVFAWVIALCVTGCKPDTIRHHWVVGPDLDEKDTSDGSDARPLKPEDHFDLGMTYYQGGKLGQAEGQFMMALEQKPDYAEAHNALGYTYYFQAFMTIHASKMKDTVDLHNKAVAHFQLALKKKPRFAEANVGLSMVYWDEYYYFVPHREEYRLRSLGYLDRAKDAAPRDESVQANADLQKAKCFVMEKDFADAKPLLEHLVAGGKIDMMSQVQARRTLGACEFMTGNKEKAIEHYRWYLEKFPNAPDKDKINDIIVRIEKSEYPDAQVDPEVVPQDK